MNILNTNFQRKCWLRTGYGLQKLAAICYVQTGKPLPDVCLVPESVSLRLKITQQQFPKLKSEDK